MPYEIGKLNFEALLGPISAAEDALARLDERVARSEVGQGFAERADFFEAVSNMWVAGARPSGGSRSPRCQDGRARAQP